MNSLSMQCQGCGSGNVTFSPQRRMLVCNQCGKEEYYSRASLNTNGKVLHSKRNAIEFFKKGNLELSSQYAREVINISLDNAPALYILAYHDEFARGRAGTLKAFFLEMKDAALEYDEIRELMGLFLDSPYKLMDYENQVLRLAGDNLQSDLDKPALLDFADKLCPFLVMKRPSMGYLTSEMAGIYEQLAKRCGIPKTCFALIQSIKLNPDSPFVNDSFYLKHKSRYFYDHYVLPIQKILMAMEDSPLKDKFLSAYQLEKSRYEKSASLQGP